MNKRNFAQANHANSSNYSSQTLEEFEYAIESFFSIISVFIQTIIVCLWIVVFAKFFHLDDYLKWLIYERNEEIFNENKLSFIAPALFRVGRIKRKKVKHIVLKNFPTYPHKLVSNNTFTRNRQFVRKII